MKKLLYIYLLLSTTIIYASKNTIMIKIRGLKTLPPIARIALRSGLEESITRNGYALIEEEVQNIALREQSRQQKRGCYDVSCLVKTGKMLAAQSLLIIDIQLIKQQYFIKSRLINLETGATGSTISNFYPRKKMRSGSGVQKTGKTIIYQLLLSATTSRESFNDQKVMMISRPSGAAVTINSVHQGETPFELYASDIKGEITFKREGYLPKIIKVDPVQIRVQGKLSVQLNPLPRHTVYIDTEPSGGMIYIDDKEIGKAPLKTTLIQGEHQLEAMIASRDSVAKKINIDQNNQKISLPFGPRFHTLKIKTIPESAKIAFNNFLISNKQIQVYQGSPGKSLEVNKRGYHPAKVLINFEKYQDQEELVIKLKPVKYYPVTIKTVPESSEIHHINHFIYPHPDRYTIPGTATGKKFTVTHKGYYRKTVTITKKLLQSGGTTITLKPIPRYRVILKLKQKDLDVTSKCSLVQNRREIKITGYANSSCTIKFYKKGYYPDTLKVHFKRNETITHSLKKINIYRLKFSASTGNHKIKLIDKKSKYEKILIPGKPYWIAEGEYQYKTDDPFSKGDSITLDRDRTLHLKLNEYSEFFRFYLWGETLYSNNQFTNATGAGFDLHNFIRGRARYTVLGGGVYLSDGDSTFFWNLYTKLSYTLSPRFSCAISLAGTITESGKVIPSFDTALNYRYQINRELYIGAELSPGIQFIDNADRYSDLLKVRGGIFIGVDGIFRDQKELIKDRY